MAVLRHAEEVTGNVASVTGAFFADADTIDANQFVTGDVDLTTTPTSNAVSMDNMAPGDIKYGSVTVKNSGSLEMRYALKSVTNGVGRGSRETDQDHQRHLHVRLRTDGQQRLIRTDRSGSPPPWRPWPS